jgi:hypothetical protein
MRWTLGMLLLSALALLTLAIVLVQLLRCRHRHALRQHREDGWYLACLECGRAVLLNPRHGSGPQPIGTYSEAKAIAGAKRSAQAEIQHRKIASQRAKPAPARSSKPNNVLALPVRKAGRS